MYLRSQFSLTIALLLWLVAGSVSAQTTSTNVIVATVGGEAITESQVRSRAALLKYDTIRNNQQPPSSSQLKRDALEEIISIKVQTQYAASLNLNVSSEDVEQRINQIADNRNMSIDEFSQELTNVGVDFDYYRSVIRDEALVQRFLWEVIAPTVEVPENEIEGYIKKYGSDFKPIDEYDLDLIVFNIPPSATNSDRTRVRNSTNAVIDELRRGADFQEVAGYLVGFDGIEAGGIGWNRPENLHPSISKSLQGSRAGNYVGPIDTEEAIVIVRVKQTREAPGVDIPDSTVYHLRQIMMGIRGAEQEKLAEKKINQLHQELLNGAEFSELAQVHTENGKFRKQGGDMGWVPQEELPPSFLEEFDAIELGGISKVLKYQSAFFIFQVIDRRSTNEKEKIRKFVLEQIRNRRLTELHTDWIANLRNSATIEYKTAL